MTTISPDRRTRQKGLAPHWSFLTNHTYVLLAIARDRDVRLREIASQVGITERAVQKIIGELEASGILTKSRDGRRNHYEVDASVSLRHPLEGDRSIAALLGVLLDDRRDPAGLAPRA
jgi:biotin operon repressor